MTEAPPLRYDDPLRESTRKERRALLVVSFIGLLVTRAGLLPTRIEAFGLSFDTINQRWLLISCAVLILYFMLAFLIYALTDWFAHEAESYRQWDAEDRPAEEIFREVVKREMERQGSLDKTNEPIRKKKFDRHIKLILRSVGFRPVRVAFDFVLPLLVGGVALVLVVLQACSS